MTASIHFLVHLATRRRNGSARGFIALALAAAFVAPVAADPGGGNGSTGAANPKFVPAGAIVMFGGPEAPSGWLPCDGSDVSRSEHADLFAAIGTTYGDGDGSTTFTLPDLRQRFPLGRAGSGTGSALGEQGGQIDHSHDVSAPTAAAGDHGHAITATAAPAGDHSHGVSGNTGNAGDHQHGVSGGTGAAGAHAHSYSGTVAGVGGHQHVVVYRSATTDPANPIFALWHSGDGQRLMRGRIGGTSASGNIASNDGDQIYQGFGVFGQEFRSGIDGAHAHAYSGTTAGEPAHAHGFSAASDTAGSHAHGFSATSATTGSHAHAISASSVNAGGHAHSLDAGTSDANPPYLVVQFIIKD